MDNTIGITGGIGAGKSVVARVLRCNGFPVYDCDSRAKWLMEKDDKVKSALLSKIGKETFLPDGRINKIFLTQRLFTDTQVRNQVNAIVHDAVRKDIQTKREKIAGLFFIESAILASGGIAPFCSQVWIIESPKEERFQRLFKRDKTNEEEIVKRMRTQEMEIDLLKNYNTLILHNNASEPLLSEVLKLTNKYKNHQTYKISC